MNVLPTKWVFRLNPLDQKVTRFLHKARCVAGGDIQEPGVDFDPDSLYAPVAFLETIRTLLAIAAEHGLLVEGYDLSHAFLHGKIDMQVLIEQPENSTGIEEKPGRVFQLKKSM